jgi:hypothetical protein
MSSSSSDHTPVNSPVITFALIAIIAVFEFLGLIAGQTHG